MTRTDDEKAIRRDYFAAVAQKVEKNDLERRTARSIRDEE